MYQGNTEARDWSSIIALMPIPEPTSFKPDKNGSFFVVTDNHHYFTVVEMPGLATEHLIENGCTFYPTLNEMYDGLIADFAMESYDDIEGSEFIIKDSRWYDSTGFSEKIEDCSVEDFLLKFVL